MKRTLITAAVSTLVFAGAALAADPYPPDPAGMTPSWRSPSGAVRDNSADDLNREALKLAVPHYPPGTVYAPTYAPAYPPVYGSSGALPGPSYPGSDAVRSTTTTTTTTYGPAYAPAYGPSFR
jgi:hypothetical protein